jgi:hypothetical protein
MLILMGAAVYHAVAQWQRMQEADHFFLVHRVSTVSAMLACVGIVVALVVGPRRDDPDAVVNAAGLDSRTWWVLLVTVVLGAVPFLSITAWIFERVLAAQR